MKAIIRALTTQGWGMHPQVLRQLAEVVVRHASGERLSREEVATIVAARGSSNDEDEDRIRIVDGVGIISINGIISKRLSMIDEMSHRGTSTGRIEQQISLALNDPNIRAMVLDIDSPGGSIAGVEAAANAIRKAARKKPIVASIPDMGASAAYWMGSQANEIYTGLTGHVGSIGVYMVVPDSSQLYEDAGVKIHVVRAGALKGAGVEGTEVTEEQLAKFQSEIDAIYGVFVDAVAKGRNMTPAAVRKIATGEIFIGGAAKAAGLVDEIGTIEDAIAAAKRLAANGVGSGRKAASASATNFSIEFKSAANPAGTVARCDEPAGEDRVFLERTEIMPQSTTPVETPQTGNEPPAQATAQNAPAPSTAPSVPAAPDAAAITRDAVAAERVRMAEIRAMAKTLGLGDEWADKHCTAGTSVAEAKRAYVDDRMASNKPVANAATGIKVGEDRNLSTIGAAMEDAIMVRGGVNVAKPHDRAAEFRGMRLLDLAREHLQAHGVDARRMGGVDIAKACFNPKKHLGSGFGAYAGTVFGHSTSDFPMILENVAKKTLRAAYLEAPHTWSQWMKRVTTNDLKQITRVQMSAFAELQSVNEGEEYTEATIGEARERYSVAKYGRMFSHTLEMLINDDLDAFVKIPTNMGRAARRLENRKAYEPMVLAANGETMGDSVVLFHTTHANITGTGTALSVTSLGVARAMMRLQVGLAPVSERLNLSPEFLIIPAALETLAEQLIGSIVDPTKSNATPNPFSNKLKIIVEPLLDAGNAYYAGDSNVSWYLAANHRDIDTIEVCFLDGYTEPTVEEMEGFDVDGRKYKVRHFVAAKAIDHRGLYKNAGA